MSEGLEMATGRPGVDLAESMKAGAVYTLGRYSLAYWHED